MEELILRSAEYFTLTDYIKHQIEDLDFSSVYDRQRREELADLLDFLTAVENVQYDEGENMYSLMLSPEKLKYIFRCLIGFLPTLE